MEKKNGIPIYNLPGVDNDPEYTQGQRNHSSGLVL